MPATPRLAVAVDFLADFAGRGIVGVEFFEALPDLLGFGKFAFVAKIAGVPKLDGRRSSVSSSVRSLSLASSLPARSTQGFSDSTSANDRTTFARFRGRRRSSPPASGVRLVGRTVRLRSASSRLRRLLRRRRGRNQTAQTMTATQTRKRVVKTAGWLMNDARGPRPGPANSWRINRLMQGGGAGFAFRLDLDGEMVGLCLFGPDAADGALVAASSLRRMASRRHAAPCRWRVDALDLFRAANKPLRPGRGKFPETSRRSGDRIGRSGACASCRGRFCRQTAAGRSATSRERHQGNTNRCDWKRACRRLARRARNSAVPTKPPVAVSCLPAKTLANPKSVSLTTPL